MIRIYLTQDRIGTKTGGGVVTLNEYRALEELGGGQTLPVDNVIVPFSTDPFENDLRFLKILKEELKEVPKLAHIYSGCFSETVKHLKSLGTKVAYTAAAHDPKISREEHEALGIPFDYPHLTDPKLWAKYLQGYLDADLVICPSVASGRLMVGFGCREATVIPHGVNRATEIPLFPKRFSVGYFGSLGVDKGVYYLLEAWKKLAWKDAILVLGGRASMDAMPLIRQFGGGNVRILGEVDNLAEFYREVSVYVQPSSTEGFGIEVLEAMAHGRPVVSTTGVGASDVLTPDSGLVVQARSSSELAGAIEKIRPKAEEMGKAAVQVGWKYSWEKIRPRYREAWDGVLNPVRS
jgi:glycosyltransferase involved in cell wall biosynthesis